MHKRLYNVYSIKKTYLYKTRGLQKQASLGLIITLERLKRNRIKPTVRHAGVIDSVFDILLGDEVSLFF